MNAANNLTKVEIQPIHLRQSRVDNIPKAKLTQNLSKMATGLAMFFKHDMRYMTCVTTFSDLMSTFKVPMTRKFLLFYLKEHEKINGLAVYSNTLSLLVAELFTKI